MLVSTQEKVSTKRKQLILLLLFVLLLVSSIFAQPLRKMSSLPPQQKLRKNLKSYIQKFSNEAINQMVEFKIPASVVLAQAIFESASGTSDLAIKSKNHFGIKCHNEWIGDTIVKDDDDFNECFRRYDEDADSYRDHSLFLASRPRYVSLFNLSVTDYKAWCYGLKEAGYATYESYADDLILLIENEKLYELDRVTTLNPVVSVYENENQNFPEKINFKNNFQNFELTDFSKTGLIWMDEQDVLVQSIEMIIEGANQNEELAKGR